MKRLLFAQLDLFAGLSHEELAALESASSTVSLAKHCVLFNEGDSADALYVVESGRIKVFCSDRNGKEFVVNVLEPGDYFGELALLDGQPRSASVRSAGPSTLRALEREPFLAVLERHPAINRQLIRNLTGRIRGLTEEVKTLALQDVYGRVCKLFLQISETLPDGRRRTRETLTQREIASRVGASREMIARILKELAQGGYVEWDQHHLLLSDRLPEQF